ncbi:MAG: EAL domain-containing protein [Magnetococcus sp. WYHC-3]
MAHTDWSGLESGGSRSTGAAEHGDVVREAEGAFLHQDQGAGSARTSRESLRRFKLTFLGYLGLLLVLLLADFQIVFHLSERSAQTQTHARLSQRQADLIAHVGSQLEFLIHSQPAATEGDTAPDLFDSHLRHLEFLLREIKVNHQALVHGSGDAGLPAVDDDMAARLFFSPPHNLNQRSFAFQNALEKLLVLPRGRWSVGHADFVSIQQELRPLYLQAQVALTRQLEGLGMERRVQTRSTHALLALFNLVVLFLSWFIAYHPVQRGLQADQERHEHVEDDLRKAVALEKLLLRATTLANSADSSDAAFMACLEAICTLRHWPVGHVYRMDDHGGIPLLTSTRIWWLSDPSTYHRLREMTENTALSPGQGLAGRAAETGQPVWSHDLSQESSVPQALRDVALGVNSALAFPILCRGRVAAVMEFQSQGMVAVDSQLLEVLSVIGTQLGLVLEREQGTLGLQRSQKQLKAIVDSSPDGIIIADEDGLIVDFNPAAGQIFGYLPERVIGRNLAELIVPERYREAHREAMRRYRGGRNPVSLSQMRREMVAMRSTGEEFPVEVSISGLFLNDRRYFTGFVRDVSERKRTEERMHRQAEEQAVYSDILQTAMGPVSLRFLLSDALAHVMSRSGQGHGGKGAVFLRNRATGLFDLVAAYRFEEGLRERLKTVDFSQAPCLSQLASDKIAFYSASEESCLLRQGGEWLRSHGHYMVPLVAAEEPLGVMVLFLKGMSSHSEAEERFLATIADMLTGIVQRKQAEQRSFMLSEALEQSPVSVIITELDGRIDYVNRQFVKVSGYSAEEVLHKDFLQLHHVTGTSDSNHMEMWDTIVAGESWRGELYNATKSGDGYWEYVSVSPLRIGNSHNISNFLVIKEDITLRKEYEDKLFHQANFDTLTDLPNRLLVIDRLRQAVSRARRSRLTVAVLFLDLDEFKKVNDSLGHAAGDQLLKEAAQRITGCLRESDTVGRFGSDEFTIILPDLEDILHAELIADKLLSACTQPFFLAGQEIFMGASLGISIYPTDGDDAQTLLRNADTAMYRAKQTNRGGVQFFMPDMNRQAEERVTLERSLRYALERNDALKVHYQPLVCAQTGRVLGAEALVRWEDERMGFVPPGKFIPLAEDTGLIVPLGDIILNQACRDASRWQSVAEVPVHVAVNVSTRQLKKASFIDTVRDALDKSGLPPARLKLEITEGVLLEYSNQTIQTMKQLVDLGVHFSIDDFGTGYSSLSYLTRFPFDSVKIDRSFINDMVSTNTAQALVGSIVAMSHQLGMGIVAEGVETPGQLKVLQSMRADLIQGWLFSKAVPMEKFLTFLDPRFRFFDPGELAQGRPPQRMSVVD